MIKLERTYEVEEPSRPTTLQDLMSRSETQPNARIDMDTDTKPDINEPVNGNPGVGIKPIYGFEGVPSLPPKWTYATPEIVCPHHCSLANDRMR